MIRGRSLLTLMDKLGYYPMEEEAGDEPVTTSVQLPQDLHRHIEFTAKLWNAIDEARGTKRRHKWKASTVIRRLCLVGTTGVAAGIGGIPDDEEEQQKLIAKVAAEVARKAKK